VLASIRRRATAALLASGLAFSLVGTCPCVAAAADGCGAMAGHATARPCCEKTSSRPELRPAPCCDSKDRDDTGVMTTSTTAPGPEASSSLVVAPGAALPLAAGLPGIAHRTLPPRHQASPVLRI